MPLTNIKIQKKKLLQMLQQCRLYFYFRLETRNMTCSSIISRLVKDVVSVSSDTLTPKHSREAQTLRNLILRNLLITTFRLTDDEFADL